MIEKLMGAALGNVNLPELARTVQEGVIYAVQCVEEMRTRQIRIEDLLQQIAVNTAPKKDETDGTDAGN